LRGFFETCVSGGEANRVGGRTQRGEAPTLKGSKPNPIAFQWVGVPIGKKLNKGVDPIQTTGRRNSTERTHNLAKDKESGRTCKRTRAKKLSDGVPTTPTHTEEE